MSDGVPGADTTLEYAESLSATLLSSLDASGWFALFNGHRQCIRVHRGSLGRVPEGLLGLGVAATETDRSPVDAGELIRSVLDSGRPVERECVFDDPRVGPRAFEFQFCPIVENRRAVGAVVRCTESTVRVARMRALHLQGQLLGAMSEAAVLVDSKGEIRLTNPACESMFGYGPGSLVGRAVGELGPALVAALQRAARSVSSARSTPITIECMARDGRRVFVTCSCGTLRVHGIEHTLAILSDVTERRRLEHEVLEIEVRERERIARDLHDGLGQELTGVSLLLKGIETSLPAAGALARERLAQVGELVAELIRSTREIASGIFAPPIAADGLPFALRGLAARSAQRASIDVQFDSEPLAAAVFVLDPAVLTHLYRIAQEATTNALRHSLATEIRIQLCQDESSLRLVVRDNGKGFAPEGNASNGTGLRIMRFRAQAIDGRLSVESAPGRGTTVSCTLPRG